MSNITLEVVEQIKQCLERYNLCSIPNVVIAFSGGLDSTVLADAAIKAVSCDAKVVLLHINHGLSANAKRWQQHCAAQAKHWNVEFRTAEIEVDAKLGGIEAAAREGRYQQISAMTQEADLILLGQHANDQIETFLLQLMRGAGPKGLSAMPQHKVDKHSRRYCRPLLNLTREHLAQYANENALVWVEDESNAEERFNRNFLRRQVVKPLIERWPVADKSVLRSIEHIQQQTALIEEETENKLNACLVEGHAIEMMGLCQFSDNWQKQILRTWLGKLGIEMPSEAIMSHIIRDVINSQADAAPVVSWGDASCRRFQQKLYMVKSAANLKGVSVVWQGEEALQFADAGILTFSPLFIHSDFAASVKQNLTVSFSGFGQRFTPAASPHSKPIKQWYKEWGIAPWDREVTPIIGFQDQVLQIGNRPSDELAKLSLAGNSDLIRWQPLSRIYSITN